MSLKLNSVASFFKIIIIIIIIIIIKIKSRLEHRDSISGA